MKVTEYFVGFGPRLWSFRRGETEYGIKALPLGGYVKIPGMTNLEEVDPADEGRLYRDKPFHSRLLVAVAGSAMHFLMAFVLLWALFTFVGVPDSHRVQIQGLNQVGGRAGPAQAGGIRTGDVVVSVDGTARRRERGHPDHGHPRPPRAGRSRWWWTGTADEDPDRHPGQRPDAAREGIDAAGRHRPLRGDRGQPGLARWRRGRPSTPWPRPAPNSGPWPGRR